MFQKIVQFLHMKKYANLQNFTKLFDYNLINWDCLQLVWSDFDSKKKYSTLICNKLAYLCFYFDRKSTSWNNINIIFFVETKNLISNPLTSLRSLQSITTVALVWCALSLKYKYLLELRKKGKTICHWFHRNYIETVLCRWLCSPTLWSA